MRGRKKKKHRSEVSSHVVMVINTRLGNMINANKTYKNHLEDLAVN